jgi:hypothetical protein
MPREIIQVFKINEDVKVNFSGSMTEITGSVIAILNSYKSMLVREGVPADRAEDMLYGLLDLRKSFNEFLAKEREEAN